MASSVTPSSGTSLVVLASGGIVDATTTSHRDTWLALKGGSNNFGIVTAFEQDLFEQEDFWGGIVLSDPRTFAAQFSAFEAFTGNPYPDPHAALIMSSSFVPQIDQWLGARNIEYTKVVTNPLAFENFTALPVIDSPLHATSTMRISNFPDFTQEIAVTGNPPGMRNLFLTTTYRNSAAMIGTVFQAANDTVQEIQQAGLFAFTINFQPVRKSILQASADAGGNSLNLNVDDASFSNFLLTASRQGAENDALIEAKTRELYARAEVTAQQLGLQNGYVYLN